MNDSVCELLPQVTQCPNMPLEPLLKWTGGKRWLIEKIRSVSPLSWEKYYEPFFGGGALFFALSPHQGIISDSNLDLIECYRCVADRTEELIESLSLLSNDRETYYMVRASTPEDTVARATRLIYLCSLSFNGLYRVNLKGQFNVPYGRNPQTVIRSPDHIRAIASCLRKTKLLCLDFEEATLDASSGDFVFFDPPYTVTHNTNGFIKYNANLFTWSDQVRLAHVASELRSRGCYVIISNSAHACITELYPDFERIVVSRHSVMAASSVHRRSVEECLYVGA